jgi:hypothetical protein
VAQKRLKTPGLGCLVSLNLELQFEALDLLNQAHLTRMLPTMTYEMKDPLTLPLTKPR